MNKQDWIVVSNRKFVSIIVGFAFIVVGILYLATYQETFESLVIMAIFLVAGYLVGSSALSSREVKEYEKVTGKKW